MRPREPHPEATTPPPAPPLAASSAGGSPTLVWQTYPLGLLGADQTGDSRVCRGGLRDLISWLPHIASMGANTLLLGPIFSSLSHGYDTVTHHEIDERPGGIDDLDVMVGAARSHGVGVVLDGVFAYASRAFWRLSDPAELRAPWFRQDAQGHLVPWRVDSLVTPDYDSAGYQTYVADVMSSWLDRGITGWRLDSSWSVPAPFWRKILARVRRRHPDAWCLGQVFDDDLPSIINQTTYSSATEYALMHGTRDWLASGAVEGMVSTLRLHQSNCTRNPVHTFLGNHDFPRLADTVDADLLPAAFAVLLTVPGVPGVYYGDEFGVRSRWAEGGSDAALRPPMSTTAPTRAVGPAADLLDTVRRLGRFRRSHRWLTSASLDGVRAHEGAIAYSSRGGSRARLRELRTGPRHVHRSSRQTRPRLYGQHRERDPRDASSQLDRPRLNSSSRTAISPQTNFLTGEEIPLDNFVTRSRLYTVVGRRCTQPKFHGPTLAGHVASSGRPTAPSSITAVSQQSAQVHRRA